ncbi:MFS transporter [Fodinicola acaciae]|uniref:MFS transporter n=1 Tax=Fodinicola acaciae TaxID=2681555 RepID=UPI0013D1B9D8|nr:MFS transporter [Fodinicola acaciae]
MTTVDAATRRTRKPALVLAVLCLITFMTLLDAYGVALAAPAMQRELPATLGQVLWVLNGYTFGLVVMPIAAGRLGDRFGPRRLLLAGLGLFTVASAGCALAPDGGWLIAVRIVQGVGAGLLAPQSLSLVTHVFPPHRRGWALGVSGAVAGFAVAAGPSLGGILVSALGWRGVFLVNLPLGVAAGVLVRSLMPNPVSAAVRMDVLGQLLLAGSLAGVTYVLIDSGPGWLLALAAVLAVVFVAVEFRRRDTNALIPLRLLRNRDFSLVAAVVGTLPAAVSGMTFLLSTYLQNVASMSAYAAGLLLAVAPAVSIPFSHYAGAIVDRRGPRPVLVAGLAFMAAGVAASAVAVAFRSPVALLVPGLAIFGVGMGVVFSAPFVLATRSLPAALIGTASGVFGTAQRLGGMLGLAAAGAVLRADSIRDALLVPLAMLILAIALSGFTARSRPSTA